MAWGKMKSSYDSEQCNYGHVTSLNSYESAKQKIPPPAKTGGYSLAV